MAARSAAAMRFLRAAGGAARAFRRQAVAEAKSDLGENAADSPLNHGFFTGKTMGKSMVFLCRKVMGKQNWKKDVRKKQKMTKWGVHSKRL